MIIIILWGLFLTRLAYSLVGLAAPKLFVSAPFVVVLPIPVLIAGIWIGAKIYDAWPEGHKTIAKPLSLTNLIISATITLPLFYLLWPLLVRVPSVGAIGVLVLTLIPCALKCFTRRHAEEPPNEVSRVAP